MGRYLYSGTSFSFYDTNLYLKRFYTILFFACLIVLGHQAVFAQVAVLSGTVVDSLTQKPIANVYVSSDETFTGLSDSLGDFQVQCDLGKRVAITFYHAAYEKHVQLVDPQKQTNIKVSLVQKVIVSKELEVTAAGNNRYDEVAGAFTLRGKDLKNIPGVLGEPDVIRAVMAMPGVQSVNEGVSGLYVRGGGAGQNAFYFDDIELLNPYHLLGTFSVFNPILTDEVNVFKGSPPVHYPSKLSSSILVNSKNSYAGDAHFEGSLGTISSNLTFQTTNKSKRLYVAMGVRKTTLELYKALAFKLIPEKRNYFENSMYGFYDVNGKVNYTFKKGLLSLAFYTGADDFNYDDIKNVFSTAMEWGNDGASLNYAHSWNDHLTSKHILSFNQYTFGYKGDILLQSVDFRTKYERLRLYNNWELHKNKHTLNAGVELSAYWITPQFLMLKSDNGDSFRSNDFKNTNLKFFMGDYLAVRSKWAWYLGAAVDVFTQFGPYAYYPNDTLQSPIVETGSTAVQTYASVSPVTHLRYQINALWHAKASYSHSYQNIHLGSLATVPLPADVWMPSTLNIKPEQGHQLSAGVFYNSKALGLKLHSEVFFRSFKNQLLFTPLFSESEKRNFEDNFEAGKLRSAGIEFFVKKTARRWNAQLAYTLSKVQHSFPVVYKGEWFDAKQDRPHDLNVMASYKLKSNITCYANWIFTSGNKTSLPEQAYWEMGYLLYYKSEVNNFRYPSYQRLDVGMDIAFKSHVFNSSVLTISCINVYNRSNPYFVYFQASTESSNYWIDIQAKQLSLFPLLPSLSWRFKF